MNKKLLYKVISIAILSIAPIILFCISIFSGNKDSGNPLTTIGLGLVALSGVLSIIGERNRKEK